MLGERMLRHKVSCWLVNTGWIGGAYGTGERINLDYTRAMVNAAIEGKLEGVPCRPDPVFQVAVPQGVPVIPPQVLNPREMWKDKAAYDRAAQELSARFHANFKRFAGVESEIMAAAPRA
jgi:phosphoenolpyruvate carboxykinase (ATP)